MKQLVVIFWNQLRLSKPWNAKVPFLISILYFFIILGSLPIIIVTGNFLASIVLIIGFAGLAYILNDLGDKNADEQAKKPNATTSKSGFQLVLLILFFIVLIGLPWIYLPFDLISLLLIIVEISLFFMYALPPFRLKEHGWLGVLSDALYGHFIPAALAIHTYSHLSAAPINNYKLFVLFILAWQFILGLRNIIFHQLQDYENDLKTLTNTLVVKLGSSTSIKLVLRLLCLESIFICCFLFVAFLLLRFKNIFNGFPYLFINHIL